MRLAIGHQTDVGRRRPINQDSYAIYPGEKLGGKLDALLVVADGMGGAKGGEVASGIVAQSVPQAVQSGLIMRKANAAGGVDVRALLHDAIMQANGDVYRHKVENRDLQGMGTTCVAAIVQENRLTVGNVGDSRAYLLRRGRLSQITEDHSLVWQEYRAGRLTREQLRTSQFRNQITRGIGLTAHVEPEMHPLTLEEGDTLLLCSDGLTVETPEEEIARVLATSADPQEACNALVQAALRNGGSDNITVIVLRYGAFTSLALTDTSFDPNALLEDVEDVTDEDDITDEQQAWRRQSIASVASVVPAEPRPHLRSYEVADEPDEDEIGGRYVRENGVNPSGRSGQVAARSSAFSSLSLTLITLLVAAVAALGWQLYRSINERTALTKKVQELLDDQKKAIAARTTPRNLTYSSPTPLLGPMQLVRNDVLQVYTDDSLLVVSNEGRIWRIDPATKGIKTISGLLPVVPRVAGDDAPSVPPAAPHFAAAVDNAGNCYQIDVHQKLIQKYNYEGQKVGTIGGEGRLTAPTAVAVDTHGNVYIIDNHVLKRSAASETPTPAR